MGTVRAFEELQVWQDARRVVNAINKVTAKKNSSKDGQCAAAFARHVLPT